MFECQRCFLSCPVAAGDCPPQKLRPAEVDLLLGDPTKAKMQLGWKLKTSFEQLVDMMTDADLKSAEREKRADG